MAHRRLTAEQRAKLFKALSDPRRIEIVDALAEHGPLCGTELAEKLGISLALLSHHWDVLVAAGLIQKTRVGQIRYCTLDPERLQEATVGWDEAVAIVPSPPAPRREAARPAPRKKSRPTKRKPPAAR